MFNLVKFDSFSDSVFQDKQVHNVHKTIPNFCLVLNIFTIKKAAVVSNFCLIGKICRDFLVPTMIELGCKTFMPFQTSDLHRMLSLFSLFWCCFRLICNSLTRYSEKSFLFLFRFYFLFSYEI